MLFVFRLQLGDFFGDLFRVDDDSRAFLLLFVIAACLGCCTDLAFNLIVAGDKLDVGVHLGEVDQMQTFLHFLSFLRLHLSLHIDHSNVTVFLHLARLVLVSLKNDSVLPVHHLGRVHFVVELVWVS